MSFRSGALIERRNGLDRRNTATFPPLFSARRRRKSKGRRKDDRAGYVDIYDSGTWGIAAGVLILSMFDGVATAIQINAGKVREANPVMNAAILSGGVYTFYCIKAMMTALPLAIIILHKEWALARYAARLCLFSYVLIALYHLYLVLA
jgi:hypothetical protein